MAGQGVILTSQEDVAEFCWVIDQHLVSLSRLREACLARQMTQAPMEISIAIEKWQSILADLSRSLPAA